MPDTASKRPNVTHLRAAIDSGLTGDKAPQGEVAAAPLGADDEAAGAPSTASQVEQSLAHEVAGRPADTDATAASTISTSSSVAPPPGAAARRTRFAPWLILTAGIAVTLVALYATT